MVEVEAADEFREWFDAREARLMERIIAVTDVLQDRGPDLREPYCKPIKGSRHAAMQELRTRDEGNRSGSSSASTPNARRFS
jgi:hypothetical protein